MKIEEILLENWKEITSKNNFCLATEGTKIVRGQDTGELCIKIMVAKKMSEENLDESDIYPQEIGGVKTDIVEMDSEVFSQNE